MNQDNKILIPIAIIVTGVIIGGAIILSSRGQSQPAITPTISGSPVVISTEGEPILGSPSAPVTMIEFSDFECPYCGRYSNDTFPQIKKEYVDTGKVKVVFKNFPLPLHKDAQLSAEAGECAFSQNKFWEYKEVLFKNQVDLSANALKKYASSLGLDAGKFNQCLDSRETKKEVERDLEDGRKANIGGTPSFFVNGEPLVGAQPYSAFKEIFDRLLKNK